MGTQQVGTHYFSVLWDLASTSPSRGPLRLAVFRQSYSPLHAISIGGSAEVETQNLTLDSLGTVERHFAAIDGPTELAGQRFSFVLSGYVRAGLLDGEVVVGRA